MCIQVKDLTILFLKHISKTKNDINEIKGYVKN